MLVGVSVCMAGCGGDEDKSKPEEGPREKTRIVAPIDKAAAIKSVSQLNSAWSLLLAKNRMFSGSDLKPFIVSATDFESTVATLVSANVLREPVAHDQFQGCTLDICGTGESLQFIIKQD